MNTVKIIGLVLILVCCSAVGLIKGEQLRKRSQILREACVSFEKLYQMLLNSSMEREELLEVCFGDVVLSAKGFAADDKELFQGFLKDFGMGDREKECRNIMLYKTLFQKQLSEAEENAGRLYKLYNSLGFLVGLVICIFIV